MVTVIGWKLVGGACVRGRKMPGWNELKLDNGTTFITSETLNLNQSLDAADAKGYDTKRMRERTEEWIKTGTMPPA